MWVQAGVIMDIQTGNWRQAAHAIGNLPEQFAGLAVLMVSTRPAAAVIELVVEAPQAVFRSMGVSN